jgi:AcrR family transcriptional regulator
MATADAPPDAPPVRRRLPAAARKSSILEAARRAFTETGDMGGTTIRVIADRAGISEGIIYRHFDSKEQLFFEAVVEPLTEAVDALVEAAEVVDRDEPLTPERQVETMQGLYRQLVATLETLLPLLGLVLFGDPKVAREFYRDHLSVAMDRLSAAWHDVEARYGHRRGHDGDGDGPDISARAVTGIALVLALEHHNDARFDLQKAIGLASQGTLHGFFPALEPGQRRG